MAVALNLVLVGAQVGAGIIGHSTALLADAGHNFSDVLALLLAWGAGRLATRPPSQRFTYGFKSSSILAALANAAMLWVALGAILIETLRQFVHPQPVAGPLVMLVAGSGIVINGLPIMLKKPQGGSVDLEELDTYYEDCVIGGPGAFMITVDDTARFAMAIRRKLVLEIAGMAPEPKVIRAAAFDAPPRIDCLIGEKQRGRWLYEDPGMK